MNKPKISFVMPWHISERGGGAEVQANYLAQELSTNGFLVSYICQTEIISKINTIENIGKIKVFWLKSSGRFKWLDQGKYYDCLKKNNPDYVLQRLSSNVSYVIGKYCRNNNKIFHWFCTDNHSVNKSLFVKNFIKKNSLKEHNFFKYFIFYVNAIIMDFFRNRGMKKITNGWSQNSYQYEFLLKNFNLDTKRVLSGHPKPNIEHSPSEILNFKTILWCANFGKHKRPEKFIELANKMVDEDFKFVMVGSHSNQEYLKSLLKVIPNNLTITGKVSFEKSLKMFESSSIFINTSTNDGDGFPNTFIQAWNRGLPTLTLGFDPDNIIEKRQLGFNCLNIDEVAAKIKNLYKNENDFIKISTLAKKYSIQNHSLTAMTDNFLKYLY